MKTLLKFGIGLSLLLVPSRYVGAEQFSQAELPHIIVVVCDMVGLDLETRLLAKKHTIRIFRRAGINVNWIDANELASTAPLSSSRAKCVMPSMESSFCAKTESH
jgi:hypothetical protein